MVLEFVVSIFQLGLEFVGLGSVLVMGLGTFLGLGPVVVVGAGMELGPGLGAFLGTCSRMGTCTRMAPDNPFWFVKTS